MWIILLLIILFDNAVNYAGGIFSFVDFVFIAAVITALSGRFYYTPYVFIGISSLAADSLYMPFFGVKMLAGFASIAALRLMRDSLYVENLTTRIFFMAAGTALRDLICFAAVLFFYWEGKAAYFPWEAIVRYISTVSAGVVVIAAASINTERTARWLKKTLRRT